MSTTDGFRADWAQKDFYAVLGVKKDATLRARSRRPTASWRGPTTPTPTPVTPRSTSKFKAVAEAYDVVGDAEKRKKYDEMRSLSGSGGGFGGGGFGRRQRRAGSTSRTCCATAPAAPAAWRPVRRRLRRRRTRRTRPQQPRPQKGADAETTATISFTDAIDGVTISLRLTSDAPCPDCNGTGGKPGTSPRICPECEGAGYVVNRRGRRVLDQRDLPHLRRAPAGLRRGLPHLPRQRARHVGAQHPGPHPRRGQGRPADPAERQGRGRCQRRPGR